MDAAAGDDHKDPAAVAEAKAKITEEAEQAQQRAEEEKKAEDEDKVPKYVLTKYERIEFEDLLKAHTARLDALKACKAEIVKAPTPKAMTETPLEGDALCGNQPVWTFDVATGTMSRRWRRIATPSRRRSYGKHVGGAPEI